MNKKKFGKYSNILESLYVDLNQTEINQKYIEKYKSIGIDTIGDLFLTTMKDLRKTKRIPSKGIHQAKRALEKYGFILKDD